VNDESVCDVGIRASHLAIVCNGCIPWQHLGQFGNFSFVKVEGGIYIYIYIYIYIFLIWESVVYVK
jgi:hypothetical protein